MPERCSCGTELVEDARFCHKCGAPQRAADRENAPSPEAGDPVERPHPLLGKAGDQNSADPPTRMEIPPLPIESPPATPPPAKQAPINLTNPAVVRSAGAAASLAALGSALLQLLLPMVPFLPLIVFGVGGYYTVRLYHRLTGEQVEPGRGARLGWICGWFVALIQLIVLTFTFLLVPPSELLEEARQRILEAYPEPTAEMTQMADFMISPLGMTLIIVFSLLVLTLPPALGGLFAARSLSRR